MFPSRQEAGRGRVKSTVVQIPYADGVRRRGPEGDGYVPQHRQSLGDWWSSSIDDETRERQARATGIPLADMMPQREEAPVASSEQISYVLDVRRVLLALLVPAALVAVPTAVVPAVQAIAAAGDGAPTGVAPEFGGALVRSAGGTETEFDWAVPVSFSDSPERWDWLCYDQGDARWGEHLYQNGSIAGTGCGVCSAAHALTMLLDEEIRPDDLSDQMAEYAEAHGGIAYGTAGTVWAGWEACLGGLYGDRVSIEKIDATAEAVRKAVTDGKVIVYNVPAGFSGIVLADGTTRTTYGGHVLTCYRYADGYFYVKDSSSLANGHGLGNSIRYTAEEFADSMAGAKQHLGYVYAFDLVRNSD